MTTVAAAVAEHEQFAHGKMAFSPKKEKRKKSVMDNDTGDKTSTHHIEHKMAGARQF